MARATDWGGEEISDSVVSEPSRELHLYCI